MRRSSAQVFAGRKIDGRAHIIEIRGEIRERRDGRSGYTRVDLSISSRVENLSVLKLFPLAMINVYCPVLLGREKDVRNFPEVSTGISVF